jgi:hypothetical protein
LAERELSPQVAALPPFSLPDDAHCLRPFDLGAYADFEGEKSAVAKARCGDGNCTASEAFAHAVYGLECAADCAGTAVPTCADQPDNLTNPACGTCPRRAYASPRSAAWGADPYEQPFQCDERCRDHACEDFTCGAPSTMAFSDPAEGDCVDARLANRSLVGDGICDEKPGRCLPGTDKDCDVRETYYKKLRRLPAPVQYLAAIAPKSERLCKQVTVLERCGACRSADYNCSKFNGKNDSMLELRSVCKSFKWEREEVLWRTPWCEFAFRHRFERPSCDCMPKLFNMHVPHWQLGLVLWGGLTAVAWVLCILVLLKWRWGYGEFGISGSNAQHNTMFRAEPKKRQEIAFKLLERQLQRPLSHGHLQTWQHKPPRNLAKKMLCIQDEQGTLSVHNDYVFLKTVSPKGCCCCKGATLDKHGGVKVRRLCSADEDEFYCLLKGTSPRRWSHFHMPLYIFYRESLRKYTGWCNNASPPGATCTKTRTSSRRARPATPASAGPRPSV